MKLQEARTKYIQCAIFNQKREWPPQATMNQNGCIPDMLYQSKIGIDNSGTSAGEYKLFYYYGMFTWMGFSIERKNNLGNFSEMLGLRDTVEGKSRKTFTSFTCLTLCQFW